MTAGDDDDDNDGGTAFNMWIDSIPIVLIISLTSNILYFCVDVANIWLSEAHWCMCMSSLSYRQIGRRGS